MKTSTLLKMALPVLVFCAVQATAQSLSADPDAMSLNLDLEGGNFTRTVNIFLLVTALSVVPSFIVMMTSFTRIVIVLGLLRQALGTQNAPSGRIISGLALFLSIFIMHPVWTQIYDEAITPFAEQKIDQNTAMAAAATSIKGFMLAQTRDKSIFLFMDMGKVDPVESPTDLPLKVIIPAFMVSELQTAFQMGFLIFLPFLVIDAVTATFLMSMGMMMLPPMMISLPFKLLLFIIADGWHLVVEGLVKSFAT